MKWKTDEVSALLVPFCKSVAPLEPGGDIDTTGLLCDPIGGGDAIYVNGFSTNNYDVWKTPDDVEIEMVEVYDGISSNGGLYSSNTNTCILYGQIVATLRQAGFIVVRTHQDYF
jgi:hypothetical protein